MLDLYMYVSSIFNISMQIISIRMWIFLLLKVTTISDDGSTKQVVLYYVFIYEHTQVCLYLL
jgi:hypothetical protein